MNVNILCLVRIGSGRNRLVQLLIQAWNVFSRTIQTLSDTVTTIVTFPAVIMNEQY